jgi:hypothetical protein
MALDEQRVLLDPGFVLAAPRSCFEIFGGD